MVVESMGGGNAGADQMMPYGDDALYGKELRDALGSFPGAFPAAQPAEGAAADPKSTLANYEIRGVAQVFDGAPTDVYVDGNATDDAADSENDEGAPIVDAHMFDDLPVDTSQWSDVMRRRANGTAGGSAGDLSLAFQPRPVNPTNAAQQIFARRFSGAGASTPSMEDLRTTTATPPPVDGDNDDGFGAPRIRTPTSREVLDRVKGRTPKSTEPWAMATAAAAAAVQKAIERQEIAIQAKMRGVELAREADEALGRAKEAAQVSAAVKRGDAKPVPRHSVPASVMKARRDGQKKRKGSPDGSDALDSPASAAGKDAAAKKGKHAAKAQKPKKPRAALDIKNDPRSAEVAKMWRKAAELDACAVCGEPEPDHWDAKDEIIFCDGCDLQVHLSCYGMRKVPDGEWMCVGCNDGLDVGKARLGQFGVCALCPQPGGALAKLDPPSAWDVAWESPGTHAHIACAECLPEVFILRDKKSKPPLIDMSFVKGARMNLRCSLCDQEGACTQCAMKKCYASFHPLCARASGFANERHAEDGRPMMFCKVHSGDRWAEQRRLTAGKPAKDPYGTDGQDADGDGAPMDDATPPAEVIDEDAVGAVKSKFISLNGEIDVPIEPPVEKEGDEGHEGDAGTSMALRLWDGFAPFIADKRERSRLGKSARKLLTDAGVDQKTSGRLTALDSAAGEREARRAVRRAEAAVADAPQPETPPTLAPGLPAAAAAQAAATRSMPWRVLRAHQRAGVEWLSARHMAGVGSIVCDRVGAGKRLTVLSHLMHLRDSMNVKGSHLLVCQPEAIAAWTADVNKWCPRLRAVTLTCPADERNPAKAAILRAGADLIIVPADKLVEAAAEAKAAEAKAAEVKAAEAKAAEEPVNTDEAQAAAQAAAAEEEAAEAAAAAEAAEASSSKKSKKKKKKKSGGGSHQRKPEEDGVLPSSLSKLTFHTMIVDAVGDAAEAALPVLAKSDPHARVKFGRAVVVARDTVNTRGAPLRAALSILFPAVFHAMDTSDDGDGTEFVDAEALEQEWSGIGGGLKRMTTLRRVADFDVDGGGQLRVDETLIVARPQSSLFQERYVEILGRALPGDDDTSTLRELRALCASDLEGSGKLRTLDLLIPRLRVERRAALVVSSSPEALDAVATLLTQRRITHFRLDGPDVALGTRLHAAARFPWSFKAGGGVRVLLCAVAAAPDLTKEVVGKVDSLIALDVADEAGIERCVHRLTGVGASGSNGADGSTLAELAVVKLACDGTGETRALTSVADAKDTFESTRAKASSAIDSADWAIARRGASGTRVVTLKEGLPVPLDGLFIAPTNGWFGSGEVDPVEAENDLEEDERAWAVSTARCKSRAHAASAEAALAAKEHDLTKYQWHERRCLNCKGEPERCVHIPPAFVGPDVAAKRLECRLCPRVTSFGCAALTQTPRGGWVCPQHVCHGCGVVGADHPARTDGSKRVPPPVAAVLLRCVSCPKAFCDHCSGGAEFEAVETTPAGEWERNSFFLPARSYEYVKCQLCATKPLTTA